MSPRVVDADALVRELRTEQLLHERPCNLCGAVLPVDDEAEEAVLATLYHHAREGLPLPAEVAPVRWGNFSTPRRQWLAQRLLRDTEAPLSFVQELVDAGALGRLRVIEEYVKHLDENVPVAMGPSLVEAVRRCRDAAALRVVRAEALTVAALASVRGLRSAETVPRLERLTAAVRRVA